MDVAAHAGVDYSTVSLALRGDKRITDQTREKVQKSANRLGYMPNHLARSLSGGSTRVLGVMFTEMSRFFSEPLEILQTAGERAGYTLSVHFSSWNQDRERQGLRRFCESCVDGVIWAPSQWAGDSFAQMAQDLEKQKIPCVLLGLAEDERVTSCHQVGGLREEPIRLAIGHLKELGHRRIGLVTAASMPGMYGGMHRHRLPTYQAVLKEMGITLREQDMFDALDHDHGGLEIAVELSRRPRKDWPSAILATDDMLARSLAKGLQALGITIPQDISLMGFDVVQDAEAEVLSSVSMEVEETARRAIELMLSLQDKKTAATTRQRIIIPPRLIVGSSCVPLRYSN